MPPKPLYNRQQWAALYEAHNGNLAAIARAEGRPRTTLLTYQTRYSQPDETAGPADFQATVLEAAKKRKSVTELADELDCSPRRIIEAVTGLKAAGQNIDIIGGQVIRQQTIEPDNLTHLAPFTGTSQIFGAIADTHGSSKTARPKDVQTFYRLAKSEGASCVFHAGDMTEGMGVYRGQEYEILDYGQDAQINRVKNEYPDDLDTYVIGGNHDLAEYLRGGCDPIAQIANQRPDIHYLGKLSATVELPHGAKMEIVHPDKGGSYALSYLPQRWVDNLEGGSKPNIVLFGHWHISQYFDRRNIHTLTCGCFQGQTSYLKRKGIQPSIGGWLVELTIADDGSVTRFKPEFVKFF